MQGPDHSICAQKCPVIFFSGNLRAYSKKGGLTNAGKVSKALVVVVVVVVVLHHILNFILLLVEEIFNGARA